MHFIYGIILGCWVYWTDLMALTKLSKGLLQHTRGIALYSALLQPAIKMLPGYEESLKEKILEVKNENLSAT